MKWKCPICNVDRTVDVCPQCGDDLRKWKEMNVCAAQLCGEGARYAREGKPLRATLAFTKAVVLNPGEPAALKALGNILAQQGEFEEAIYYLTRCRAIPPEDPEVWAALAKIKALLHPVVSPAAPSAAPPADSPEAPSAAPPADSPAAPSAAPLAVSPAAPSAAPPADSPAAAPLIPPEPPAPPALRNRSPSSE